MFRNHHISGHAILVGAVVLGLFVPIGDVQAKGKFEVLHSFCAQQNCTDGQSPYAGLMADKNGNFYGTTSSGGANGFGVIFKLKE